jgi:predicted flap endonuclease-1-like 5' DNA nuclease
MVESQSNNKVVIFSIISGLLGVFVGLVILGWWLFPVQWTGGTLEIVDAQIQEDWLRMAIDSYSINQDQELAQSRYEALGSQKEVVLVSIWDDPGQQSPASIKDYSVAVGVDNLADLTPAPTKPNQSSSVDLLLGRAISRPLLATLLVVLCLFGIGVLAVIFIVFRSSRRKGSVVQPPAPDLQSQAVDYQVETTAPVRPEVETTAAGSLWEQRSTVDLSPPAETAAESLETGGDLLVAASLGGAAWSVASLTRKDIPEQVVLTAQPEAEISQEVAPVAPLLEVSEAGQETPAGEAQNRPEMEASAESLSAGEALAAPLAVEPPSQEAEADTPEYEQESLKDIVAKFNRDLTYVEGIGDAYAQKLSQVGILTLRNLLEQGATPKGRKEIADKSGISPKLIMRWVNHVDLFRIKGVGQEYADLLESAGVDTVVELATRNAEHLFEKMLVINEQKNLVRKTPVLSQIHGWIEQAKRLPRAVQY